MPDGAGAVMRAQDSAGDVAPRAWLPQHARDEADAWLRRAVDEQVIARIWRRDDTLWGPPGAPEVADRLGWLDSPATSSGQAEGIERFAAECRADGFRHAVLLGMGGSSLAPEVLRRSLVAAGGPGRPALTLHVLDSVDPDAVLAVERAVGLERTLFVVSTKSGDTIETLSLARYFLERVGERVGEDAAGPRFAAITDPGSSLLELARARRFRRVFLGDPEIGGRFSALSAFGTVPGALAGVDLRALLATAAEGRRLCGPRSIAADNLGLHLGVLLGSLARGGRDKLGLVIDEPLASLGLWLEQLLAESTGKDGRGIVPVVDEPPDALGAAGSDRAFLAIGEERGPAAARARELAGVGHPAVILPAGGPADLGRLFFIAEMATAVAGWVLEVNPFDQPDVQESKKRATAALERAGRNEAAPVAGLEPGSTEHASASVDGNVVAAALVEGVHPPEYVAILAYLTPSAEVDRAVARLRAAIAASTGAAVTFGYGPRYLHSTGQLHKGGPATGRFLVLVRYPPDEDVAIPGAGHGFATLLAAQAEGDLAALEATGRPVADLVLADDPAVAIDRFAGCLAAR